MTTSDDYSVPIAQQWGLASADARALAPPGSEERGRALAQEFGLPWINLRPRDIASAVLSALPRAFVMERQVVPFAEENGVLRVAVTDPIAVDLLDELASVAGRAIEPALASRSDVLEAIDRYYGRAGDSPGMLEFSEATPPAASADDDAAQATESDAPVIRLVQHLIAEAARRRASDIHLEPLERRFRVRFRIDGALLEVDAPPKRLQLAVISRVKIMANLSIAE